MNKIIKLTGLMSMVTLISGCVGGSPQYSYKPASYSSQNKSHSEAAEYCSYSADNKTDDYYDRKKEELRADFTQRNRESNNRNYATTTNCKTVRYGYGGPEIQCESKNSNSGFGSGGYQTNNTQLNFELGGFNLARQLHEREKYNKFYRDCMFNEGYKRVEAR